jgi:hypothetical protein
MFFNTRRKIFNFVFYALIFVAAVIFLLSNSAFHNKRVDDINYNISDFIDNFIHVDNKTSQRLESSLPRIFLFNLSRPLEPPQLYDSIKCRKSLHIYVKTMLCVHNVDKDIHVSGSIWRKFLSKIDFL